MIAIAFHWYFSVQNRLAVVVSVKNRFCIFLPNYGFQLLYLAIKFRINCALIKILYSSVRNVRLRRAAKKIKSEDGCAWYFYNILLLRYRVLLLRSENRAFQAYTAVNNVYSPDHLRNPGCNIELLSLTP